MLFQLIPRAVQRRFNLALRKSAARGDIGNRAEQPVPAHEYAPLLRAERREEAVDLLDKAGAGIRVLHRKAGGHGVAKLVQRERDLPRAAPPRASGRAAPRAAPDGCRRV